MDKWILKNRDVLLSNEYIELVKDEVITSNGTLIPDYYYINTKHAVAIVALDENQNVILKREYRHPLGEMLIELPAGAIEEDESDGLEAAKRELLEETGYKSNVWTCLGRTVESPSKASTEITIYLAQDAKKVSEQSLDKTEDIEVLKVSLSEAVEMCLNNQIRVNSSVSGILKASKILEKH